MAGWQLSRNWRHQRDGIRKLGNALLSATVAQNQNTEESQTLRQIGQKRLLVSLRQGATMPHRLFDRGQRFGSSPQFPLLIRQIVQRTRQSGQKRLLVSVRQGAPVVYRLFDRGQRFVSP